MRVSNFPSFVIRSAFLLSCSFPLGTSAYAAVVPYDNPGVQAQSHSFIARSSGDITAYFAGYSADFSETLGYTVNGVTIASGLLNNKTTQFGSKLDLGSVKIGDVLTFFIDVANTKDHFSSDTIANSDGVNHAYAVNYQGGGFFNTPAGVYVGFEDLRGGGDLDYNDTTFYFTNVKAVSSVPLPASAPMFGAALLALGAVGFGLKRRKAVPAA